MWTSPSVIGVTVSQSGVTIRGQGYAVMARGRTALLIRCSCEEADKIREMAKRERRTVSGYVLHAVMNRIALRERVLPRLVIKPKRKP